MTGAFVDDDPNTMRDYTYMSDHMGNIVGLVDCENETGHRQVFDAFGNVIGDFVLLRCAADHDWTDHPCHLTCVDDPPIPPCPREVPLPVSRMQAGGFNWRGNEGSITDRVLEDIPDSETHELRWSSYERPSTGFVYMQARYYEPATGRFLTADAVPYGFETVLTGQNNRWTYCANDPVNFSDPSGKIGVLLAIALIIALILLIYGAAQGIMLLKNLSAQPQRVLVCDENYRGHDEAMIRGIADEIARNPPPGMTVTGPPTPATSSEGVITWLINTLFGWL